MNILALIFIMLAPMQVNDISPLGLDWRAKHKSYKELPDYRYYYGSVNYGLVVYLGTRDLIALETELQVYYGQRRITKALLVLGPAGLNYHNCLAKHTEVIRYLNDKYGTYKTRHIQSDPLALDLLYTTMCKTIQLGLYEITTTWIVKQYKIELSLIGDDEGIYLEIEYTDMNTDPDRSKLKKKENLKRL